MNFRDLNTKSVKVLKEVCRNDRSKYRGYSYHTKKADLIQFIIRQTLSDSLIPRSPTPEVISDLSIFFETEDELEERYSEMYMERPHDDVIKDLLSSLRVKYSRSNVIFDSHPDDNNDMIYKANKGKYISQYGSLGSNGEMVLYHGTNGDNLIGILGDDFRLTCNPVHGSLFGKGIYFTNDIEKAIYYSEKGKTTKYVIVCVVHIGDIVKGNHTMDIHPLIPDSSKRYDTSVDDIREPKQFIKKKNGTYNILGILTIENYRHSHRSTHSFDGSFRLINTKNEDIILYWVKNPSLYPYIRLGEVLNTSLCKSISYTRRNGNTGKLACMIGHKFICARIRDGQKIILKVFVSGGKGETFKV